MMTQSQDLVRIAGRPRASVGAPPRWGRWTCFLLALVAAAPGLHAQDTEQVGSCLPAVPCADSLGRGCPDLVVDPVILAESWFVTLRNFSEPVCAVVEGEVASGLRRLIRFTSNLPNLGPGDLVIGNPFDHPEWFDFDTCHRDFFHHQHLRDYADYRLWTPAGYEAWKALRATHPEECARDLLSANPDVAAQMVSGHKQGFCLVDTTPSGVPCPHPLDPISFGAGGIDDFQFIFCDFQGLDVCWADEYHFSLDGQWVDITGLPNGSYVLEVEVNAKHFVEEGDYTNNSAAVPVRIDGENGPGVP